MIIRRVAYVLLSLILVAEAVWMTTRVLHKHVSWLSMWYPLFLVMPFALLALTYGRNRWIASLMRLPIGLAFLQSVADRFGLFGKYGAPGVAFGDFAHFSAFTQQLNPFLPAVIIPPLAVLVTILESTFAIGLLLGVRTRLAAAGAAGLLFLFGTAMTLVLSYGAQASYGVFAMSAGAWALSLSDDPTVASIDALLRKR